MQHDIHANLTLFMVSMCFFHKWYARSLRRSVDNFFFEPLHILMVYLCFFVTILWPCADSNRSSLCIISLGSSKHWMTNTCMVNWFNPDTFLSQDSVSSSQDSQAVQGPNPGFGGSNPFTF